MPAVYDNPDTNCREIYVHGHLVTYYTEDELNKPWYLTPVQQQFLDYALKFGPYNECQTFDDPTHLPVESLATEIFLGDTNRKP